MPGILRLPVCAHTVFCPALAVAEQGRDRSTSLRPDAYLPRLTSPVHATSCRIPFRPVRAYSPRNNGDTMRPITAAALTAALLIAADLATARFAPVRYLDVVELTHGCHYLKRSDTPGYDTWQCGDVVALNAVRQ